MSGREGEVVESVIIIQCMHAREKRDITRNPAREVVRGNNNINFLPWLLLVAFLLENGASTCTKTRDNQVLHFTKARP